MLNVAHLGGYIIVFPPVHDHEHGNFGQRSQWAIRSGRLRRLRASGYIATLPGSRGELLRILHLILDTQPFVGGAVDQKIVNNLILDTSVNSGVAYSRAISTDGKTGMRLDLKAIYAGGAFTTLAEVEQSVDLVNWSASLFTTTPLTLTASTVSAKTSSTSTATLAGYVRVKFTVTGAKTCVAAVADFFDYLP